MERMIRVLVAVSDDEHAKIIKADIETVVRQRTTIYHIDKPCPYDTAILDRIEKGDL